MRCGDMRTFSFCAYFVAATVRLSFQEPTKNEGEKIARARGRGRRGGRAGWLEMIAFCVVIYRVHGGRMRKQCVCFI